SQPPAPHQVRSAQHCVRTGPSGLPCVTMGSVRCKTRTNVRVMGWVECSV
ncbi:hypothetical protein COCVIDRAFT_86942, partial [Bipolaris victoriae FI3]